MYEISKEFHFSAAHQLGHLPEGHPCARLHGHNYIVVVTLGRPQLDDDGFVRDYGELNELKVEIDKTLDHRNLNDVMPIQYKYTTAENIARWIFEFCRLRWPETLEVAVSETPKTWARYREEVVYVGGAFQDKYGTPRLIGET